MDTPLTEFVEAAAEGRIVDVKNYLKRYNIDVNETSYGRWPALHEACYKGHRETAKFLLDNGADIEGRSYGWEFRPLDLACMNGNILTVELLLDHGANANAWHPLYKACIIDNLPLLKLLLDRGADMNSQDNNMKSSPLHIACYGSSPNCLRELLLRGADLTLSNKYNETAFDVARSMNHEYILDVIMKFGMHRKGIRRYNPAPKGTIIVTAL